MIKNQDEENKRNDTDREAERLKDERFVQIIMSYYYYFFL